MPERPDLSAFVERTKNRGFPFSPRTLNEARVEFFRPEFEELLALRALAGEMAAALVALRADLDSEGLDLPEPAVALIARYNALQRQATK